MKAMRTRSLTEGSQPACGTVTGPAHVIAGCIVLTVTSVPAAWSIRTSRALVVTALASETCLADALPADCVAAPITVPAVTRVQTVRSPMTSITGSPAVVASPSWGTLAAACGGVTMPLVLTNTSHLTAQAIPAHGANVLTQPPHESWSASTLPSLLATPSIVLTGWAAPLAAQAPAA